MATRDPGSDKIGSGPSTSPADRSADPASPGTRAPDGSGSPALREETRRLAHQAKDRARSYAGERKQKLAEQVGGIAEALRSAAEKLGGQNQSAIADYANRAAGNLDRLSGALRERDLQALARQAQDLARQQPALLIGGAMVAGFLAARFAKASAEQSDSRRSAEGRRLAEGMSESGTSGRGGASETPWPAEGGTY